MLCAARCTLVGSPLFGCFPALPAPTLLKPCPPITAPLLQYELVRYRHPDADLATTDLQALQGAAAAAPVPPGDDGGGEEGEGRLLGLRLAFTLPASCYATMLIRELTKQPTSVAHHKALQQQPQQEQQPAAAAEQQEGQQQEQEEGVGGEPAAGTA